METCSSLSSPCRGSALSTMEKKPQRMFEHWPQPLLPPLGLTSTFLLRGFLACHICKRIRPVFLSLVASSTAFNPQTPCPLGSWSRSLWLRLTAVGALPPFGFVLQPGVRLFTPLQDHTLQAGKACGPHLRGLPHHPPCPGAQHVRREAHSDTTTDAARPLFVAPSTRSCCLTCSASTHPWIQRERETFTPSIPSTCQFIPTPFWSRRGGTFPPASKPSLAPHHSEIHVPNPQHGLQNLKPPP